uniref:Rex protein n=4 Tax=Simian T-lymphotropic virus 1 TaxID=33747 RepID=A0A7R6TC60_9STL1|nr:Rex protein [Simian T-lymphotropic virus 1]BBM28539.1 Rex protein [Simian T-lymphotropic virus 1]BBM28547.1 Rex protein [Simian T-lymphotropic virus 1]BBM28555.1 Rex protein [Simian T-lymphotropic virus 1]BBM28571.1 Rex protein [Simian T-lymphotropic virus 1]
MPKTRRGPRRSQRKRPPTPWPISQVLDRAFFMDTQSTYLETVCKATGAPSLGDYARPACTVTPYWPPVQSIRSPGTPLMDALSAQLCSSLSLDSPPSPPKEPLRPSRSLPRRPLIQPPTFHPPSSRPYENTPPSETDTWSPPLGNNSQPCPFPTPASGPKTCTPSGETPLSACTSTNFPPPSPGPSCPM